MCRQVHQIKWLTNKDVEELCDAMQLAIEGTCKLSKFERQIVPKYKKNQLYLHHGTIGRYLRAVLNKRRVLKPPCEVHWKPDMVA